MLENAYMIVLIILLVNIVYVSMSTIRMILTLKGRRYLAASVSVFEITVYVLGLSLVLDNLDAIQNIIAYALGFGIGVVVGSKIEEKLALGYITVNVISSDIELHLNEKLRDKGYGVTSWLADGRDGHRSAMQILTPRKYEINLYEDIKTIDERAFIVAYEPKQIYGGFWVKHVRKGRLFNHRKRVTEAKYGANENESHVEREKEQEERYSLDEARLFNNGMKESEKENREKRQKKFEN